MLPTESTLPIIELILIFNPWICLLSAVVRQVRIMFLDWFSSIVIVRFQITVDKPRYYGLG